MCWWLNPELCDSRICRLSIPHACDQLLQKGTIYSPLWCWPVYVICILLGLEKLIKSIRNTVALEATPSIIPRNFKEANFGFVKRKIFLPVGGLWPWDGLSWEAVDSHWRCSIWTPWGNLRMNWTSQGSHLPDWTMLVSEPPGVIKNKFQSPTDKNPDLLQLGWDSGIALTHKWFWNASSEDY